MSLYACIQLTNSTPSFWDMTAFQEAMMLFISEVYLWQCTRVPVSQHPHQRLLPLVFDDSQSNEGDVTPHCGFHLSFKEIPALPWSLRCYLQQPRYRNNE